jgi:hypothetical protein
MIDLAGNTDTLLYDHGTNEELKQTASLLEDEVSKLDRVEAVTVTQNVEDLWRPNRMDEELQQAREERFAAEFRELGDT